MEMVDFYKLHRQKPTVDDGKGAFQKMQDKLQKCSHRVPELCEVIMSGRDQLCKCVDGVD